MADRKQLAEAMEYMNSMRNWYSPMEEHQSVLVQHIGGLEQRIHRIREILLPRLEEGHSVSGTQFETSEYQELKKLLAE